MVLCFFRHCPLCGGLFPSSLMLHFFNVILVKCLRIASSCRQDGPWHRQVSKILIIAVLESDGCVERVAACHCGAVKLGQSESITALTTYPHPVFLSAGPRLMLWQRGRSPLGAVTAVVALLA